MPQTLKPMPKRQLVQITVQLTPAQCAAVDRIVEASDGHKSRAFVLRSALDVYLRLNPPPAHPSDREQLAAHEHAA